MKVKNMSIDFEQSVNKRRKVQASCNKHDGKELEEAGSEFTLFRVEFSCKYGSQ